MWEQVGPSALVVAAVLAALTVPAAPSVAAATPPTVAVGDVVIPEGDAGTVSAKVTIRLSDPRPATTVVRYVVGGGSATAGTDFRARSSSARIRAGKTSAVIAVTVTGDRVAEPAETVAVRIAGAAGTGITDAAGMVTIRDDDSAVDGIAVGDATVWEGDASTATVKVPVVLAAARGVDTVIPYALRAGTARAPGDYRARAGRVRIPAGRAAGAITVTTTGDTLRESDETFSVALGGPAAGVAIVDGLGTVTIRDDEAAPNPPPPPPPPPPPLLPGPPTALEVAAGPFPRYLTADWDAPATGGPFTGYDIEVARGATLNVIAGVTAPYPFGCGLAEVSDECTVRVRARNAEGNGAWSVPVTTSTWAPPAAVPNLTVLSGGGAVSWDIPASDLPIERYEVQRRALGATSWVHVDSTTLTHAATGCMECEVRVRAWSDVGFGDWSAVGISLPGPPTLLTAARDALEPDLVHITWSPPTDPGSHPVTGYEVFVFDFPLPETSATGLDLRWRAASPLEVRVYARTLVGRSLFSASVTLPAA